MEKQKRAAAIHDVSCFGKCSLTVVLPVLSAVGIETAVIPTAVLSTHTGGFTGNTYRDLTDDIMPIADHWSTLGIDFDAIYSGFLGSTRQINIVEDVISKLRGDGTLIAVDPVMADDGRLYKTIAPEYPEGMRGLCSKADIITPNLTEAALLSGGEYREGPYDEEYLRGLCEKLSRLGPSAIVLTGVYLDDQKLGCACYDKNSGLFEIHLADRVEGHYHGTGDLFAAALVAALMKGKTLSDSAAAATDFTQAAIRRTREAGTDTRFGVNFEDGLPTLAKELK